MVGNDVGRGTTFALYLPWIASGPATHIQAVTDGPVVDGRGTCVPVVEDNVEVATFSTQILEALGDGTHWVANADRPWARRLGAGHL